MQLSELVSALRTAGVVEREPDRDVLLAGVADDSRRVHQGDLFCAVEGTAADGHAFVPDAVRAGAVAAIVRRQLDVAVPQVVVRDTRVAVAIAARRWHGDAVSRLRVVAVTGTNGKTTSVALLRHLLGVDGLAGSIGTLGAFDGAGQRLPHSGSLTTRGVVELHAVFAELERRGCSTVVMEASSHALDQGRLLGVSFAAGVFTNLTQDHLDYHPTMAAYLEAKLRLCALLAPGGAAVVNVDDSAWDAVTVTGSRRLVRFGKAAGADVRVLAVSLHEAGATMTLHFPEGDVPTTLPLIGEYNVTNAVGAAAAAWSLGVPSDVIAERLRTAPQVPGRMEQLAAREFVILRDYAHTPDALDRATAALRPFTSGRIVVVFGAGGDRDRKKRPLMGRAVAAGADFAIVTADNPRSEDPERIIDEIESGMGPAPRLRITDRRDAIHHAVAMLEPGDCLLLAGKGHETYQIIGTDRQPFDERAIVADAVAARDAR